MPTKLVLALCALVLAGACARLPPSPATVAALSAEFGSEPVVADGDCIFSAPVRSEFIAYRLFGLCFFSATQLRLYYGGEKPALAFAWPLAAIKSYALHGDTFTLVTAAGNFGLVVRDASGLVSALRARGVPEDKRLPPFRAKDPSPFHWL